MQLLWAEVRESMKAVKDIQRGRYDKHRDAWDRQIVVGDKVWLQSKDLSLPINSLRGTRCDVGPRPVRHTCDVNAPVSYTHLTLPTTPYV